MTFCAICTSERGPFTRQPIGRNDAPVWACLKCTDPELAARLPPVEIMGVVRMASFRPKQPFQRLSYAKKRRAKNRELGRCINHPSTDRSPPHGPPVDGHVRCSKCIEQYRKAC